MDSKNENYEPRFSNQRFLWNMLFDLRTPTITIDGFSEILASGEDGPLSPKQASYIDYIRNGSRKLLMLLDVYSDVLRFDSYQSAISNDGGGELGIDLAKVVDESLSERRSAGSLRIDPKVEIVYEVPETLPRVTAEDWPLIRIIRLMVMSADSASYPCSKILIQVVADDDWLDIFVIGNPNELRYKFEELNPRYSFSNIFDSIDIEFRKDYDQYKVSSGFHPIMFAVIHGLAKHYGAEFRTQVSESNSTLIFRLPVKP